MSNAINSLFYLSVIVYFIFLTVHFSELRYVLLPFECDEDDITIEEPQTTSSNSSNFIKSKCENSSDIGFRYFEKSRDTKLFKSHVNEGYRKNGKMIWEPEHDRYLLTACYYGQLSNRIICLLNYIMAAGLLNRTLIVPLEPKNTLYKYDMRVVFDLRHAKNCLGNRNIISLPEYHSMTKSHVVVDEANFYSNVSIQYHFMYNMTWLRLPNDTMEKMWRSDLPKRFPACMTPSQFVQKFHSSARVLTLGDLFYLTLANASELFYEGGDAPFVRSPACNVSDINRAPFFRNKRGKNRMRVRSNNEGSLLVQPHPAILESARRIIRTYFPKRRPFLSIHWRRGDFARFCQHIDLAGCFPSIEGVAASLVQANISHVFISTDASHDEMDELFKLLKNRTIIKRKRLKVVHYKWTFTLLPQVEKILRNASLLGVAGVDLTVAKVVCAYAKIFMGSIMSTFTRDIERLRYGLGTASSSDKYLSED